MINFIIWNGNSVLFSLGPFVLRWYGVLFVLGFLLARMVLLYIYKKEGKPIRDVEILTRFILISSVIGSRLGYVLFYQPELIWTKPLEIFLPIAFKPSFHFTGLENLSGHGAILGVLIALWIYSRRRNPGQSYIQVLDRVVILLALSSIFIGMGNFLNAEIIGKPTDGKAGFVFTRPVTDDLVKIPCCIMRTPGGKNPLDFVSVRKDTALSTTSAGHSPILLYLFFKPGATEQLVNEFLMGDVKTYLFDNADLVYEPGSEPLHYTIFQEKEDMFTARIRTTGIARHPTQLYESVSLLIVFAILFWYWNKHKVTAPTGRISGMYLIVAWGLYLASGFLKEGKVAFEPGIGLNMGQILCIPLLLTGIIVLISSYKRVPKPNVTT